MRLLFSGRSRLSGSEGQSFLIREAASGEGSKTLAVIIEYHLVEVFAMSLVQENPLQAFHWEPQPEAQRFVRGIADDFLRRNTFAADLARRMKAETGTRFYDWIGYIWLLPQDPRVGQIEAVGYKQSHVNPEAVVYDHPRGMFPKLIVGQSQFTEIGIKVE